ncbi:dynamin family protein [Porphyromonas sp.]|uniref:dynamin family protein n=1 Tax=Porphyromonas sp. TaxID=1924944 RepID=UPI003991D40E
MKNVDFLMTVAQELGFERIYKELQGIKKRGESENAQITIPLVGEFSSGKTTLLNSLTDSKKLETATQPTTATIYELHFGAPKCEAYIYNADGTEVHTEDLDTLKNDLLATADIVSVYDTSTKVPSTTLLVDTPGLSSPDPKHKQVLVDFLPQADAILLVVDINQQLTRSLTDFIETIKLSKRPIFMVLAKADTKSAEEVEAAKQYMADNSKLPINQIVVCSAAKNDTSELTSLLNDLQSIKKQVIDQVDGQRVEDIAKVLLQNIEDLLSSSSKDKDLDIEVKKMESELTRIARNIEKLISRMRDDIEDRERAVSRAFEDSMLIKLDSLVARKSNNYDAEAAAIINQTSSAMLGEYLSSIHGILQEKAMSAYGSDEEIPLESLSTIDISSVNVDLSNCSNIGLNSMGHEYDGLIKGAVIGTLAVAAVGVAIVAAPAVAAAGAAGAGGAAATGVAAAGAGGAAATGVAAATTVATTASVVDTATDIGSMVSNRMLKRQIKKATEKAAKNVQKAAEFGGKVITQTQMIEEKDRKGVFNSISSMISEKAFSKPQRKKAVGDFVYNTLAPSFKQQLQSSTTFVVGAIKENLLNASSEVINQKKTLLAQLKEDRDNKAEEYERYIAKLTEYKEQLQAL